ncbi:MAG: YciI family protein [Actinomycetota bacterium]|nr:YciI family protein [Actinomycetota bacterium]
MSGYPRGLLEGEAMYFVIHALDRPDAGDLRALTRDRHLEYIIGFDVVFGGPLLDDEGEMCGSLIVVDMPDQVAVAELVADDPYTKAGLFGQVTIRGLHPVLGLGTT